MTSDDAIYGESKSIARVNLGQTKPKIDQSPFLSHMIDSYDQNCYNIIYHFKI